MTMIERVKEFAEKNFSLPENKQVFVETELCNLTNPWIDQSARFPLTDEQAVKEWGLGAVINFYELAVEAIFDEEAEAYAEARRKNPCIDCPYMWADRDEDGVPEGNEYCHYEDPSNWAPCEEEEYRCEEEEYYDE